MTWIIHKSRPTRPTLTLDKWQGTGCAAVVFHRKCPVTKQMHEDRHFL